MNYIVKIALIGDYGVGKSSIGNTFDNKGNSSVCSTIGVDFINKELIYDKYNFKLQLWDTAGQERFRSIVHTYFRELNVAVLIFDTTLSNTLYNIEQWNIELDHINKNPALIKVLVGNKVDRKDKYIDHVKINDYCKRFNMNYYETSTKDKDTVDKLFNGILNQIVEKLRSKEIKLRKYVRYVDISNNKNKIIKKKI